MRQLPWVITMVLAGCSSAPDWYTVPPQRAARGAAGSGRLGSYVAMNDPNADAHLLRDISHSIEGGMWRWAGWRPRMRFGLEAVRNIRFSLDFSIAEATFRETGPITLALLINGHPLDQVQISSAGEHHYEKPVSEALLLAGQENLVDIEPDRVWVSKEDGARLSILLIRAGFVE